PPALQAELGELHAFRAFEEPPTERAFARDVAQEELPLHLERVVVVLARHFLPAGEEIDRLRDIGVPDRLRRLGVRLAEAAAQARYCAALGAVDLTGGRSVRRPAPA